MRLRCRLAIAALTLCPIAASGAAPSNDTCNTPLPISGPGTYSFDTTEATMTLPRASCDHSTAGADLWYLYTAQTNGVVEVGGGFASDCSSIGYMLHVSLMSGTGCGTTEQTCESDVCADRALRFRVTSGSTYLLRVTTYTNGPGTLEIIEQASPLNDRCQTAIPVGPVAYLESRDRWAFVDPPYSTCGFGNSPNQRDVWYEYTASISGNVAISATNYVDISVFDGSCNGPQIPCNAQHWAGFPITAGHKYMIRLARSADDTSDFIPTELTISEHAVPPNDTCAQLQSAQPLILPSQMTTYNYNNTGAIENGPLEAWATSSTGGCGHPHGSIWYNFTAPSNGIAVFEAPSNDGGVLLAAYSSCNTAAILGCNAHALNLPVSTGDTIYLRIAQIVDRAYNNFHRSGILRAQIIDPLPNDECDNAIAFSSTNPVSLTYTNQYGTDSAGVFPPDCTIVSSGYRDLWYTWTAPADGKAYIHTCGEELVYSQVMISVYLFSCDGPEIACNDRRWWDNPPVNDGPCVDGHSSVFLEQVFKDDEYYIRIAGHTPSWSAGVGQIGIDYIPDVPLCPADFNGDSVRDVADLFAYINAWLAKTSTADFNDDNAVDVADLFAYINAWLAGC